MSEFTGLYNRDDTNYIQNLGYFYTRAQHVKSKHGESDSLIQEIKYDVIGITEIWWDGNSWLEHNTGKLQDIQQEQT